MNSSGSGTAASSSSLAAARCSSSELKNSRKFRTAMHSSLYQSNRLCGVPSIGRKTSAMSTFAGTAHSSKEQDERPIQVQPHVLSAYALNVNPNFELNVSTVARIDGAKDFPSEEEGNEITEVWDKTRTNRETMNPVESPLMRAAASNNGKDVEYTVELFARTKGEVVRYGGRGRGKQLGERKNDMTGLVTGSNSTFEER